jgi:hypothetical protein
VALMDGETNYHDTTDNHLADLDLDYFLPEAQ